ncbi:MAG: hypothetical protein RLY71_2801 [Pseudomonadota bacterium]|jgi:hypothetical protein
MGQLSYGDWLCVQREREEDRLEDEALAAEDEADDMDDDESTEVLA